MNTPLITYLTVFRSRLGSINLLIAATGFVHQPSAALKRKLMRSIDETVELEVGTAQASQVIAYLAEKRLIGEVTTKKGRYRSYRISKHGDFQRILGRDGTELGSLSAHKVDVWMSNAAVPSTIGTPTAENCAELIDLGFQLRLLTPSKNTWTSAAHLCSILRQQSDQLLEDASNPFLLGLEAIPFLKQIIACDGLLVRELLREVLAHPSPFRRDDIAKRFRQIVDRAVDGAKRIGTSPVEMRELKNFAGLVQETSAKRSRQSSAPGVLEHRVSPRLEWLTDLGVLSKIGLARNSFEYRTDDTAERLLSDLDQHSGKTDWDYLITSSQLSANERWKPLLRKVATTSDPESAIRHSYNLIKRPVGPSPIKDVALLASLFCRSGLAFQDAVDLIIELAKRDSGVRLSGGRYSRAPENVFIY